MPNIRRHSIIKEIKFFILHSPYILKPYSYKLIFNIFCNHLIEEKSTNLINKKFLGWFFPFGAT